VRGTLIETICIVIVVIFLFLGSLRTVIVPVVAIPVSLIGAVFLMQVFGFSLNLLTLLAIGLISRVGGRRRHRRRRERRSPHARRTLAVRSVAARRARARGGRSSP